MNQNDIQILNDVREFNNFDLYSKEDDINITDSVKEYYDKLLDEYFTGDLNW